MSECIDVGRAEACAFIDQILAPGSEHVRSERAGVGLVCTDRLHQYARVDPPRRDLEQLEDERTPDAAADHQRAIDAELVEHSQLIARVHLPRVLRLQWPARTRPRVALI